MRLEKKLTATLKLLYKEITVDKIQYAVSTVSQVYILYKTAYVYQRQVMRTTDVR